MALPRFSELDAKAYGLDRADPACEGVNYYMAHADDNATDDAGKLGSLIDLLAFCRNETVLNWFASQGLRF